MSAESGAPTVTDDPESGSVTTGRSTLPYRPYLDGLRTVAVALVVAFHSGLGRFDGGYIGVDIFFVLSGFLVTRLLLADVRNGGRIDLLRFYARRFRRLLPAAALTLIVTAVVFTALANRLDVTETAGSFRAAFLYVANWHFIREGTGYFAADLDRNPVLHFWSLAVEEQFYLLWPLALTGLLAATRRIGGRRRLRTLAVIVATAAFASAVWAVMLRTRDPLRSYYGTDARAYQLLAGACLALTPAAIRAVRRHQTLGRITAAISLAATVAVATNLVDLGPVPRGILTTLLTVALITSLEATDRGVTRNALSRPTMVELGRISYGIYLWHWPVIWVITNEFEPTPIQTFVITSLVATGLAAASNLLLEQPVRRTPRLDRRTIPVIATGLTISILGGLVITPTITDRADRTPTLTTGTPTVTGTDPRTYNLADDGRDLPWPECEDASPDRCILRRGTGPHLMLIGDSNAYALLPAFQQIAERNDLTLSAAVSGGCPWPRDLYAWGRQSRGAAFEAGFAAKCPGRKNDIYDRVLPALRPDIVVAMNAPYDRKVTGSPGFRGTSADPQRRIDANPAWPIKAARRSARSIRDLGPRLAIIEPIPVPTS
ncbi:MAG: acyltransferase family protein, partial [Actinomycetota bacterium]